MKMIASTKLAKAQRAMRSGKQYGIANSEVFSNSSKAEGEEAPEIKKTLYLVISSDKGLCGGIHSSVSKHARKAIAESPQSSATEPTLMVVGDKSKAQLSRSLASHIALTFNQIGRDIPTFADAAGVADLLMTSGVEWERVIIIYNKFVSAISYEAGELEVLGEQILKESRKLQYRFIRVALLTVAGFLSSRLQGL